MTLEEAAAKVYMALAQEPEVVEILYTPSYVPLWGIFFDCVVIRVRGGALWPMDRAIVAEIEERAIAQMYRHVLRHMRER